MSHPNLYACLFSCEPHLVVLDAKLILKHLRVGNVVLVRHIHPALCYVDLGMVVALVDVVQQAPEAPGHNIEPL